MNDRWSKLALVFCTAVAAAHLISQALAAVPYALGGDTVSDRFFADGGAGIEAFIAMQGSFSSRAGSGTKAHEATVNGARWDFGAGANDYASSDGTTVTFAGPIAWPQATASSLDGGFLYAHLGLTLGDVSNTPSLGIVSPGGQSGEILTIGQGATFVGTMQLKGRAANAGAETAIVFANGATLASTQAITQWRIGNSLSDTKVLEVMSTGKLNMANADGGSAGNVTVNQPSGKVAIANGAASMTLTNSLITTASGVHVNLMTNDTTCLGVYATVASGSATIGCTNSANCGTAAGCNVFFEVRN